jgi:hypothetical protein
MAFLVSVLEWFVAFGAGFFGHVVAHDFCEVIPMISEKLINTAAALLPRSIAGRYREEWIADLHAQPGAFAKLIWAAGCLRSARRMQREAERDLLRRTSWAITMTNGEVVRINNAATLQAHVTVMRAMFRLASWQQRIHLPATVTRLVVRAAFMKSALQWRNVGPLDIDAIGKIMQHYADKTARQAVLTRLVDDVEDRTIEMEKVSGSAEK